MYVGSEAFRAVNAQPIQKQRITGAVGAEAFGPSDILAGSVTITNQCSDASDYTLGGVFVGQLSVTFLRGFNVSIEDWQGKEIVVNFGLCIDEDNDTWEEFPLGHFFVYEANSVAEGIEVRAYDAMANFDKVATWQPVGTLYQVLTKLCQRCNVPLGMTQLEVEALPNGLVNYGLWPENDCSTYRDLLYWVAVTVGGFATINRDGELVVKSFQQIMNSVATTPTLPWDKRCTGARVSDYRTYYRGLYLTDAKTDEVKFYGALSGGPVYDMGKNPFIQYGTQTTKDNMARTVLQSLQVRLRPFEAQIMSAPIWELGDIISMTGGLATGYESRTVVHSWTYSSGQGTKIACFGSNPALAQASRESKAASAAGKSAAMNGISYKRYANPNEITVMGAEEKVCDIYFTAEKETDVEIWHEVLLETSLVDPSMTVEAVYYLDGVELTRRPIETYTDSADHILTLNYCMGVDEGNHRWEVYLTATGGTVTLDAEDAISVLKGQGLVKGDTWDGVIILADEVAFVYAPLVFAGVSTLCDASLPPHIGSTELSANVGPWTGDFVVYELNENVVVTLVLGDQFAHCGEYLYCGMESVLL
jgi:hypothetical protein